MPRDNANGFFKKLLGSYRNLLIYISSVRPDPLESKNSDIFVTRYYYDEAGNRTRKMVFKRNAEEPEIELPDSDSPGSTWEQITDEYYVRDASGKEIADYTSGELNFWNIYGSGNVGRINADTTKQFYLKDHLGTIRAVTNASNEVISSYDFDAWGYPLREWNLSDNSKYKFTGKERDTETGYDYFGARYYDARIGRWGGTDPLFEKHINHTPYNYVLNNQMILIDPDGRQIKFNTQFVKTDNFQKCFRQLKEITGMALYIDNQGFMGLGKAYGHYIIGDGSKIAQRVVMDMFRVPKWSSVVGSSTLAASKADNGNINLNPIQLNDREEGSVGVDSRSMGWGMTLIHEFLHDALPYKHPSPSK